MSGDLPPSEPESPPDTQDRLLQRPDLAGAGGRSARGIAWNMGANGLGFALRLVSIPILARLLSPDDYGLLAVVTAITGLIGVVGVMGVTELVVQKPVLTHRQASLMFWAVSVVGLLLTGISAASAPLVALIFRRPELTLITVAVSVTFLISGVGVVHNALMLRRLQHRSVALRELVALVSGLVASVTAALLGAGYWALVLQMLVQTSVTTILCVIAVPWRPGLPRRGENVREMARFGSGVSVYKIVNYLGLHADNLVIGFYLNASALGLYTRAYGLLTAPLQQIHVPVGYVITPTLASLWPEPERYRKYFLTVLSGLCYVCMPLVLVLAVLSDQVVAVMLGDQWLEAAEVFRWLAVVGFLQTVAWTNGWLYASSGQTWRWARWGLISRSVIIASFVVGVFWGIQGVAIAYAIAELFLTPLGIYRAGKGTPVALRHVCRTVVRPALLAVWVATAALASTTLVDEAPGLELLVALPVAALAGAAFLLSWPAARREVLGMLAVLRDRG